MKREGWGALAAALLLAQQSWGSGTPLQLLDDARKAARQSQPAKARQLFEQASLAFEAAGIRPVVSDVRRAAPARAAAWSKAGHEVVIATVLDESDLFSPELPATWIFDTTTWQPLERFPEELVAVALSGDGRWLAGVEIEHGAVRLFDRLHDGPGVVLSGQASPATELHFASDGSRLAATLQDGQVCTWAVSDWSSSGCRQLDAYHARLDASGSLSVVATNSRSVQLVDVKTGVRLKSFRAEPASPLAISGDGKSAAFVDGKSLVIVDLVTKRERSRRKAESTELAAALALNDDASLLAVLLSVSSLEIWDSAKAEPLRAEPIWTVVASGGRLTAGPLAFSPDSRQIFAGPTALDSETFEFQGLTPDDQVAATPDAHTEFSADGRAFRSDALTLDLQTGRQLDAKAFESASAAPVTSSSQRFTARILKQSGAVELTDKQRPGWHERVWTASSAGDKSIVYSRFLPDDVTLLLAEQEQNYGKARLLLVDARTGKTAQTIEALTGCDQSSIALSPSGRQMAIECHWQPFLWDFQASRPKALLPDDAVSLRFLDERRVVASAKAGRTIVNTATGAVELKSPPLVGHFSGWCRTAPGQGLDATCHADGLRIWQLDRQLALLKVDTSGIHRIALGPAGLVAVAFGTRTELWSWKTNRLLATVNGQIVRTPDGRYEVFGSETKPACLYGSHILPIEACQARYLKPGLLASLPSDRK